MEYIVKNTFKEKQHNDTIYKIGEEYPKTGFEADPKRVEFLQKIHSEYGVQFLEVKAVEKEEVKATPKRTSNKSKDDVKSGDE